MFHLRTPALVRLAPALALATFAGFVLTSSATRAAAQDDAAAQEGQEHSELHETMEEMQDGVKALRRAFSKPEMKAEALELCRKIASGALKSYALMPEAPKELDEAQKHAWEVDYRRRMLQVAATCLDFEVAIQAEDTDEGKKLYRLLGNQKNDGHDIYMPDEDQ